jgi:hypothetical protein
MLDFLGQVPCAQTTQTGPTDTVSRELANVSARAEEVKYLFVMGAQLVNFPLRISHSSPFVRSAV